MANALLDYLRVVSAQSQRQPAFDGILFEGSGPPTARTPIGYLFYADSDASTVYINASRTAGVLRPTAGTWVQLASADAIADSGTVLTADT